MPNKVISTIGTGRRAYGLAITFPCPAIVEVFGMLNYDYLLIDAEHGPFTIADMEYACRVASAEGMTTIVRTAALDRPSITRLLDIGAGGILASHVTTIAEVHALADACRFGPGGSRSFGAHRGTSYGFVASENDIPRSELISELNQDILLGVMIEEAKAVQNLELIVRTGLVDYFGIGRNDLAQSLGHVGEPAHREVENVVTKVRSVVRNGDAHMEDDIMVACWITSMLAECGRKQLEVFADWDASRRQG